MGRHQLGDRAGTDERHVRGQQVDPALGPGTQAQVGLLTVAAAEHRLIQPAELQQAFAAQVQAEPDADGECRASPRQRHCRERVELRGEPEVDVPVDLDEQRKSDPPDLEELRESEARAESEAGAIASPPAVVNAISDALGHDDIAMPATPAAVWRAAQKRK